jgi:sugar diacid utilization regulator
MDRNKCGCIGGLGWYDSATGLVRPWPRVISKETKTVRVRDKVHGKKTKTIQCEDREYPVNDPKGQFQLWIDDKWAGDITEITKKKQEMEKLMEKSMFDELAWDDVSAEHAAAEMETHGPFDDSVDESREKLAVAMEKMKNGEDAKVQDEKVQAYLEEQRESGTNVDLESLLKELQKAAK